MRQRKPIPHGRNQRNSIKMNGHSMIAFEILIDPLDLLIIHGRMISTIYNI